MRLLGLLILLCFASTLLAQNKYPKAKYLIPISDTFQFQPGEKELLDSLLNRYRIAKNDSVQLNELKLLSEYLPSHALWSQYNDLLYKRSRTGKERHKKFFLATALNNYGYEAQNIYNNWKKAAYYYKEMEKVSKKAHDLPSLGVALNNLAFLYQHQGDLVKAINYFSEAGLIFEELNNPQGMAAIYANLGSIYMQIDEDTEAEKAFLVALTSAKKAKNQDQIANANNSLSNIYVSLKKWDKALFYMNESIRVNSLLKNNCRLIINYIGLMRIHQKTGNKAAVQKTIDLILKQEPSCSEPFTQAKIYDELAAYFQIQKNWNRCKEYADRALEIAALNDLKDIQLAATKKLIAFYEIKNDFKNAYRMMKRAESLEKVLENDAVKKAVLKNEYKFEFEKRTAEQERLNAQKDLVRENEKRRQRLIIWVIATVLIAVTAILYVVFKNYKAKKESARILAMKNNEIIEQKAVIEEKQHEIIESINYAKRIQSAVLTGSDVWSKISPEHFILFKPRDIVSGDFYWAHAVNDELSVFALADCTGHGVPGGFMSMLGSGYLNEIVVENEIYSPEIILNKLRQKIIFALEQKDGDYQQKDGMDIALCVWNKQTGKMHFAGANNHLWLIRNDEFLEYKADKMPIGSYIDNDRSFQSQEIDVLIGDQIYLTTDGFPDQFGGQKGKKFKAKQLQEILLRNSSLSMREQQAQLEEAFESWKGTLEQVDDVSVLGIRITAL